jgi:hypothetical protein
MPDDITVILKRQPSEGFGTFGQMFLNGQQIAVTGELPWIDNRPATSCIPIGTYACIPHNSPAHPNTWEVSNVPHRSAILIHNGNLPFKDSEGCILVGDSYGMLDGQKAVLNSVATLNKLRQILPSNFTLVIE